MKSCQVYLPLVHAGDHKRIIEFLPRNVNHLIKVRKEEVKKKTSNAFDQEILDYHELNRAKEELQMLIVSYLYISK